MRYLIAVLLLVGMTGSALADTIYSEDFDSGVIPTDWSVWQEGPASATDWRFDQSGSPHEGTNYMFHGYDGSNDLDNWVDTQTIDMTNWENISVSFWHCGSYGADYGYTGFMVSTVANPTSGADFTELVEIGAPPALPYVELVIDASAYDYEPSVTFAWNYGGLNAHTVRVDTLLITADVGTGIEAASLGEIKAAFK